MVGNLAAEYYAECESRVRLLVDYPAAERRAIWAQALRPRRMRAAAPAWHGPARWLSDRIVSAGEWLRPPSCDSGMTRSSH